MFFSLLFSAQAATMSPPAAPPVNPIYQSLETGFKLCSKHVIRQGHLAEEHSELLEGMNVRLVDEVPENIRMSSGPLFTKDRIFAEVETDGASVFVLSTVNSTACRVVLADTTDGLRNRIKLIDNLRKTSAWTYDSKRSGIQNGMMRDELTTASGRMVAIMNGPNTIANGGQGIQAILTIALLPPAPKTSD
jgi:hypothetical protein